MSFVITISVREGLVMAADSRSVAGDERTPGFWRSDATQKLFLQHGIGFAFHGLTITEHLEAFLHDHLLAEHDVEEAATQLLYFLRQLPETPDAQLYVAGYRMVNGLREPQVYKISPTSADQPLQRLNAPGTHTAWWGGETDVIERLDHRVTTAGKSLPHYEIPWSAFALQDAVDYARYAVQVTADTMRFQNRRITVGGPVDILVIQPHDSFWVQKKERPSRPL